MDSNTAPRDENGRFTSGNPGGPGGARRRTSELRRAVQEAVPPEHLAMLMRKVFRQGLEGNLSAARLVLDHTCGRPEVAADGAPLDLALPNLRTAANCGMAVERLVAAIIDATVDRDVAKTLMDAIQLRLKSIEVNDLEQRLTELEKTASLVDPNGARHMRRL